MISSLLFYPNFIKENSTFYYYSTLTVKNYTKNTTIIFTNDNFGKKKKASNFTTRTFDPGMFENRMTSTLHSTLII